ncbi:MAG TPA: JAB domain-containing protein [Lactobacillaceae bacterium]
MNDHMQENSQQLQAQTHLQAYFAAVGLPLDMVADFWHHFPSLVAVKSATAEQITRFEAQHPQFAALWQAIQLGQLVAFATPPKLLNARYANDIGTMLQSRLGEQRQEQLWLVLLDAQLDVLGWEVIFVGTLTKVQASPREIFQRALQLNAYAIMIAHNHPSGHVQPSQADIQFSQRLMRIASDLELPLIDSFVVTAWQYWSLAEHQQLS